MKYISKILAVFCLAGLALSCQTEEPFQGGNGVDPEVGVFADEMTLSLNMVASDQLSVNTKAVDPDGVGIKNMTFFCFDADGFFLQTAEAVLTAESVGKEEGIIATVKVPNKSRIMHVICNLQMGTFNDEAYEGVAEDEVINSIEATSGLLLYWARIQVPANVLDTYTNVADAAKRSEAEAVLDWLTIETNPATDLHKGIAGKGNPIHLIRNQAKISVSSANADPDADPWTGDMFVVTGFNVYNSNAYGTIAPYDETHGYPSFGSSYGVAAWSMANNITVPENIDILDEIGQVETFKERYIFETSNSIDSPVEVIIRGYNIIDGQNQPEMYYKAEILDADNGLIPIRRNHHYQFTVTGNMYNGSDSFDGAVNGPAANNIWLSIADEVTSVVDGSFKLSVDEYVVTRSTKAVEADPVLNLGFEVQKLGAIDVDPSLISVEWLDAGQNVAEAINPTDIVYDAATGKGSIKVNLKALPADAKDVAKGVLMVRYRQLFRRITVIVTPIFDFIPVYASTEGIEGQRDHVTLVYTVPDTYPAELFPFNVLISTNDLNVRASSGQKFSIVVKGDEGYGDSFNDVIDGDNVSDVGYKYVMPVTGPGTKRVYLESLEDEVLNDYKVYVTIEASNFNRLSEPIVLSNVQYEEYIGVRNMTQDPSTSVSYVLVPQKKYAPVVFDLGTFKPVAGSDEDESVGITTNEEFLLYSQNLDHYTDDDDRLSDEYKAQFDCTFIPFNESTWGRSGRVFGFYPRTDILEGEFEIYMETNKAKSDEVIFVVSNYKNAKSIQDASKDYMGAQFRSVTFELANYRPFRFAAAISDNDDVLLGSSVMENTAGAENVSEISIPYHTNELSVSFDVTSFEANDGKSVDPFGTDFEIYIDAPMYELSETAKNNELKNATVEIGGVAKPKLEQLDNGRIVYRVNADRSTEASYWGTASAAITDSKAVSQSGERKTIGMKAKAVSTSGSTITISADPEMVTYHPKTFKVTNTPLEGKLVYGDSSAPVPMGHSVSFYNKETGERLYSTTLSGNDGYFELYLNPDRPIDWNTGKMWVYVQVGGKYYSAEIPSPSYLTDEPTIKLVE